MYSTDGQYHKASTAIYLVKKAVRAGILTRPNKCELCDCTIAPKRRSLTHAHHWNGYNNPLDVWFVCHSCNGYLQGEEFHTGKVSKEEAREYVLAKRAADETLATPCKAITLEGQPCRHTIKGRDYCGHHQKILN